MVNAHREVRDQAAEPSQHQSAVMEFAGNSEGGSSHSSGKDRQGTYGTNF